MRIKCKLYHDSKVDTLIFFFFFNFGVELITSGYLSLLSCLPEHNIPLQPLEPLIAHPQINICRISWWKRQTNIWRVLSFFVPLIWSGIVCQWLTCDWLGWSDQGILHSNRPGVGQRVTNKICFLLWNVKHIYYKLTLQIKPKMGTYCPPDLETVAGVISSSSLSEKSSSQSVSYSSGGPFWWRSLQGHI